MSQLNPCIIIDNGSSCTRAGISIFKSPSSDFPSIIGCPNMPGLIFGF